MSSRQTSSHGTVAIASSSSVTSVSFLKPRAIFSRTASSSCAIEAGVMASAAAARAASKLCSAGLFMVLAPVGNING